MSACVVRIYVKRERKGGGDTEANDRYSTLISDNPKSSFCSLVLS